MSSQESQLQQQTPSEAWWAKTQPEFALDIHSVKRYDRIETYVPGVPASKRYYEILSTVETNSDGYLEVTYRDLETGTVATSSTADIGLSRSPDGERTCWAIPFDSDD